MLHGPRKNAPTSLIPLVGHAVFAHPRGQAELAAFGAGSDAGRIQLPYGTAALIPTLLGDFTLRDCHL